MQLRPYQQEDIDKLIDINAVGIFNQQRTGKTPTALQYTVAKGCRKILIICPASLLYPWKEQCEVWTGRPCIVLQGTEKKVDKLITQWTDYAVISYDLLRNRINSIISARADTVILDEAHRIKDSSSKTAKAVFKLINTPVRLALTGTPAPNKPEEVFSILHWLMPDKYTSYWSFRKQYFVEVPKYSTYGSFMDIIGFKKGMQEVLQNTLDKISVQRKRKDVMQWLPDKEYTDIKLEPTKEQEKYLKELADYFETENVITKGVLDRLIRYRQICLHPMLIGLKGRSPKLDWTLQYLKDYPNKPVIIFSKFTSFIHLLDNALEENKIKACKIVGETSKEDRAAIVKSFQQGDLNVLLINIDAGKEGLTLDRAETTIFTDKFPPVGTIEQAEDRFVATTEDKKNKNHEVINLMMKGTYDEEINKLIKKRASSVDVINDYKKYLKGGN